jgi:hypothetical protein
MLNWKLLSDDGIEQTLTAFVVILVPVLQTNIAEFMVAVAGHVVAALSLLNEHLALRAALPILEVLLKVDVARAKMLF